MTKSNCEICGGSGYLPVNVTKEGVAPDRITSIWGDKVARCRCTLERLYRTKLGDEIFNSEGLPDSEFAGLTASNLFVKSSRGDIMPHLRYALIDRGLSFFFRVGNDVQMLDAWLSKERLRSQADGSEELDFTSLRDFSQDPQLLILFLCVVSYPNKALPSVLLETLRIRSFEGKPTWVINPHAHPFAKGHLCWSTEVEEYISSNFATKTLKPSRKFTPLSEGIVHTEKANTGERAGTTSKKVSIDLNDF